VGGTWAGRSPRVRPEIRHDRSLDGDFYDGGLDADQLSLTLDLLLSF
jgi:hypothetical protein